MKVKMVCSKRRGSLHKTKVKIVCTGRGPDWRRTPVEKKKRRVNRKRNRKLWRRSLSAR